MQTKSLTIVFTDMGGFTALTSSRSRSQMSSLLNKMNEIVSSSVETFGGRIVKNLGDGHLIVFESPTNAVLCGLAIQKLTEGENFQLRIAINSGEVVVKDNDIFGEPVNLASRLLGITEPGEVYLTEVVFLAINKNEVEVDEVGPKAFKGIPEEIRIYRVLSESEPKQFRLSEGFAGTKRLLKYGAILISLIILFGQAIHKEEEKVLGGKDETIRKEGSGTPNKDSTIQESTAKETPKSTPQESELNPGGQESIESPIEEAIKNAKGKFKGLFKKEK